MNFIFDVVDVSFRDVKPSALKPLLLSFRKYEPCISFQKVDSVKYSFVEFVSPRFVSSPPSSPIEFQRFLKSTSGRFVLFVKKLKEKSTYKYNRFYSSIVVFDPDFTPDFLPYFVFKDAFQRESTPADFAFISDKGWDAIETYNTMKK